MGIRIQPREIDVFQNDPFENDLLGRKKSVEVLTHLVGDLEGPCVLAVDAACETDFSGDPFVALASELTEGLRKYGKLDTKIDATKEAAKEVLLRASLGTIRFVSGGVLDLDPLLGKKGDRLTAHKKAQESVREFQVTLQDMARELSAQNGHPLIVMIDELDRCRPSYAVELLEVAKHLFSVDHVVFVLAVKRSELVHSIRALYGNGFNAAGYLRRFFVSTSGFPILNEPRLSTQCLVRYRSTNTSNGRKINPQKRMPGFPRLFCMASLLRLTSVFDGLSKRSIAWDWCSRRYATTGFYSSSALLHC